ncbi:MAG: hypothetical protein KDH09_01985 [Chrysiogenetes bacterium]|nr:hypothetical protein [Chrysiogenetes bacterium]
MESKKKLTTLVGFLGLLILLVDSGCNRESAWSQQMVHLMPDAELSVQKAHFIENGYEFESALPDGIETIRFFSFPSVAPARSVFELRRSKSGAEYRWAVVKYEYVEHTLAFPELSASPWKKDRAVGPSIERLKSLFDGEEAKRCVMSGLLHDGIAYYLEYESAEGRKVMMLSTPNQRCAIETEFGRLHSRLWRLSGYAGDPVDLVATHKWNP